VPARSIRLVASADLADRLEEMTHIACMFEFHSLAFLLAMARDSAHHHVRFFETRDGVFRTQTRSSPVGPREADTPPVNVR
jgi:hypothetical protein